MQSEIDNFETLLFIPEGDKEFTNPYPKEYGYVRIGTPVNVDLNKLNPYQPAFEMGKLQKAGLLITNVNTTAEHKIQGGGYNAKSQAAWGFSAATELGLKTGYVDCSLSFHLAHSSNVCTSAAQQNLSVHAKEEGGIMLAQNAREEDLLDCATQDFRDKITAIRKASTPEEAAKALASFYAVYGTGFVKKLDLGSFAVFKGKADYKSRFMEKKYNLGGGTSIGGTVGGVSVAGEYTEQNMDSKAEGTFETHSFGMPDDSSSFKWVQGFESQFAGTQLSKLANLDAWSKAFETLVAKAEKPKIIAEEPNKNPLPSYQLKDLGSAIEKMKMDSWRELWKKEHGGTEPSPGDYEKHYQKLKNVAKSTSKQINKGKKLNLEELGVMGINATTPDTSDIHPGYFRDLRNAPPGLMEGDVDFGGYGITGFEYMPWANVLPKLKEIEQTLTLSQVTMGYSVVWLSIRSMFAQYLTYCSQVPEIAPQGIGPESIAYNKAISDISESIYESLISGKYDSSFLNSLEETFREKLAANNFKLLDHYQYLIDNFDWLRRVPLGAVPLAKFKDEYWYQSNVGEPSMVRINNLSKIGPLLVEKGAYRLYPIISTASDGKPYFVWAAFLPFTGEPKASPFIHWSDYTFKAEDRFRNLLNILGRQKMQLALPYPLVAKVTRDASQKVRILPEPETIDGEIWTLQKASGGNRPDCWHFLHNGLPTNLRFLAGTGVDSTLPLKEYTYERGEVFLVPIDYPTVELAGGKVLNSGVPMWFATRTEALLAKLNALAN